MTTAARSRSPRLRTRARTILRRPAVSTGPTPPPLPSDATPPEIPLHEALRRVMRDMPPVPKQGYNQDSDYYFKRLEDVILTLREVCIRHGVTVVPVQVNKGRTPHGPLVTIDVHVTYEVTGPDGKSKTVQYVGEARSETDKATQIAMSQTWKFLMSQMFMIPTEEDIDGDSRSPRIPNVRDIKSAGSAARATEQREAARQRHPSGRDLPATGQQQPAAPAAAPAGPIIAPNAKIVADRIMRAAAAPTADDVIPVLAEAKNAKAPEVELAVISEFGRRKRAAEKQRNDDAPSSPEATAPAAEQPQQGRQDAPAAEPRHQDAPAAEQPQQRHQDAPATEQTWSGAGADQRPRAVPPVDAPAQSPQAAARVKAMEFFEECSQMAGYNHPSEAAKMFKTRYHKTLETAEVHEIEAFAAGMIP